MYSIILRWVPSSLARPIPSRQAASRYRRIPEYTEADIEIEVCNAEGAVMSRFPRHDRMRKSPGGAGDQSTEDTEMNGSGFRGPMLAGYQIR